MNYLSHGHQVTDRPFVLAGTAAPDWLRACRRRSRLLEDRLPDNAAGAEGELVEGIRKHFADDRAFHGAASFETANTEIAALLRTRHPEVRRASFLAHILIEIMLDAWLLERDPTLGDRYYDALDRLDLDAVVRWVNQYATEPAGRLADWIEGFRRIQFLRTYVDDHEVVARLEGVARRVRLPALPPGFHRTVHAVRLYVRPRAAELLRSGDAV